MKHSSRSTFNLRRSAVSLAVVAALTVVAQGASAQVTQGTGASADSSSVALGNNAVASNSSTAVGGNTVATGSGSTAAGTNATATGADSTAVGISSQATAQYANAFGYQANALAVGSSAFGTTAIASGLNAYAFGTGASASGSSADAFGTNAIAAADYSLSFGMGANVVAAATSAIALGYSAGAYASNAVAVGPLASVYGLNGLALGSSAMVQGANSVALGPQASTSLDNSVALGSSSNTASPLTATSGMTIKGTAYSFAGATPVGTVSVGSVGAERTVTNVAAGQVSANSTDAVNGSQLYAATQAIEALSAGSDVSSEVNVQIGQNSSSTGPSTTAVGASSTASGQYAAAYGANSQATGDYSVASGYQSYAWGNQAVAMGWLAAAGDSGVAVGGQSNALNQGVAVGNQSSGGNNAVAIGQQASAGPGNVSVGMLTSTTGVNSVSIGYASSDYGRSNTVSIGTPGAERTISNVAEGTLGTDAVNVDQLNAAVSSVTSASANAVAYDDSTKSSVTLGGVGATAPVQVTNVAAGALNASSTDAVNGSQLNATNLNVTAATSMATTNATAISAINTALSNGSVGLVQQTGGAPGTGALTVGASTGGSTVDFTGTGGARVLTGVANGVSNDDAVNVGQLNAALASATSGTGNAVAYDNASKSSLTFGGVGATAPVLLTNVAAGSLSATSTDVVNGSQLFATNQAVSSLGTRVSALETAAAGTSSGVSADYVQQQVAAALTTATTYTNTQTATAVQAANTYTDTQVAKVSTSGSTGDSTTVLQSANAYTDTQSAQTLAQSKSYTDTQSAQTLTQSKSYTDQQVGALSNSVDQRFDAVNQGMNNLANRIDGVGAMGAAAASAMYNPDSAHNTQAAIGVANFRGQVGYSVKVFHRFSDNAVVNVNVGGATGAAGVAVGAGVNIGF